MKLTLNEAVREIISETLLRPDFHTKIQPPLVPVAIIMVGVPGSGKSSFVRHLNSELGFLNVPRFHIASTDDLIDEWAASNGMTYSEAWDKCPMKEFNRKFKETIELAGLMNESLIIDRTNMSKKTRRGHLSMIPPTFKKYCINFQISDKILYERLKMRALETGKIITPMVLGSMFKNYEAPTKDEGFDKIIEIDNTAQKDFMRTTLTPCDP